MVDLYYLILFDLFLMVLLFMIFFLCFVIIMELIHLRSNLVIDYSVMCYLELSLRILILELFLLGLEVSLVYFLGEEGEEELLLFIAKESLLAPIAMLSYF